MSSDKYIYNTTEYYDITKPNILYSIRIPYTITYDMDTLLEWYRDHINEIIESIMH